MYNKYNDDCLQEKAPQIYGSNYECLAAILSWLTDTQTYANIYIL